MRPSVAAVLALGRLPAESVDDLEVWLRFEQALGALPERCLDEDALVLVDTFPEAEESAYGLAWTLLHFIETAPSWPIPAALDDRSPWVVLLRRRAVHGGRLAEHEEPPTR